MKLSQLVLDDQDKEVAKNMAMVYRSSDFFYRIANSVDIPPDRSPEIDMAYRQGIQDLALILGKLMSETE